MSSNVRVKPVKACFSSHAREEEEEEEAVIKDKC